MSDNVEKRCETDIYFFLWRCDPTGVMASSFLRFLDHTQRRATLGRTPLDEWSARRRDLYLTTHNTHNRQTSMPLVGFEPTISAGELPQTYALDRAATGTDICICILLFNLCVTLELYFWGIFCFSCRNKISTIFTVHSLGEMSTSHVLCVCNLAVTMFRFF